MFALLAGPLRLAAQQPEWNDARALELVRAATARRALQLADTGLRDYTARATGYVTFFAQFGNGILQTPALVKSDEIVVEVYWGAPDRSKQRIVGRRDTLLLPTDINYHRDHLAVVQNNFPDIIRLGDGDEVLDVVHPLSPRGTEVYDFQVGDSLAIRGQGLSIDVMMLRLRPKDASRPAAVGAVYVDRATSSVVRMTLSFTRAALRDPQLEDVSVILENGLVDGRFWLPRRQEIEIRRTASWMDFPAKGIIRGKWEICCVETNRSLPTQTFLGAEIVEAAPERELRAYPFEGRILDQLPEELRALDEAEVRAVQEEARALVQATALARARSGNLAARGISDFVRADRVEGLALGAGVSKRVGSGLELRAMGRYGTADSRWKGRGALSWASPRGLELTVEGHDDWRQVGETPEVSGLRNSIAAQEFGSDWTNPISSRGGELTLARRSPRVGRLSFGLAVTAESPLTVHASGAWRGVAPTLPAERVDRQAATLGWERAWLSGEGRARTRADGRLTAGTAKPTAGGGEQRFARMAVSLETERALPLGRLVLRSLAAGVSAGDIPLQEQVFLGGPISGPGYDFHSLVGGVGVSQRVEWQVSVPFVPISLGRFGRVPASLRLAPFAHAVWLDRGLAGRRGSYPALGLAAIGFFDLVRVDVARGLRDGRWTFSLDVSRELWPVL